MAKPYEKRKEYEDAVLKFIEDKLNPVEVKEMDDSEGILHGREVMDGGGEFVTVGWDYVRNQVMYLRTCQPLMAKAAGMPGTEEYD